MYKVSRSRIGGRVGGDLRADIVEVRFIRRSCHLLPLFGPVVPRDWTSSTTLDTCEHFFLNPFSDYHMYMSIG